MIKFMRRSTWKRLQRRARKAERRARRAERLAYTDGMTGLGNRLAFDEALNELIEREVSFSIIIFDMANLKPANTALGHWGADDLLKQVGATIRHEDMSYRTGGDEFAVLLPGCPRAAARTVRDRLEADFGTHRISDQVSSFLVGTTTEWGPSMDRSDLLEELKLADLRLENRKLKAKMFRGEPTDRAGALEMVL